MKLKKRKKKPFYCLFECLYWLGSSGYKICETSFWIRFVGYHNSHAHELSFGSTLFFFFFGGNLFLLDVYRLNWLLKRTCKFLYQRSYILEKNTYNITLCKNVWVYYQWLVALAVWGIQYSCEELTTGIFFFFFFTS